MSSVAVNNFQSVKDEKSTLMSTYSIARVTLTNEYTYMTVYVIQVNDMSVLVLYTPHQLQCTSLWTLGEGGGGVQFVEIQ